MQIFNHLPPDQQIDKQKKIEFLDICQRVFWDLDINKLDLEKHAKLIITQVINYGYPHEIRKMFQIYSDEIVRETLEHPIHGVWFPVTYHAFCNMLDAQADQQAINMLYQEKVKHELFDRILAQE